MPEPMERETLYLRLPRELKQRIQEFADRAGDSLADAAAHLLQGGFAWETAKGELAVTKARAAGLDVELAQVRAALAQQIRATERAQGTLRAYEQQIELLNQWLKFPIAQCKQHCGQSASLQHVVYNQCPRDGGPSPHGFELLPQYDRPTVLEGLRDLSGLVGVASMLVAIGRSREQG